MPLTTLVSRLLDAETRAADRPGTDTHPGPVLVAVSGHSSSGKTMLAGRLVAALPQAGLLHTDDLAWNHGVLSWDEPLLHDVLPVVRTGAPLRYRPPGWVTHDREGAVELPGGLRFLVVEGVGASQPTLRASYDVVVWVETDEPTRVARDGVRVDAGETSPEDYLSWMAEEHGHLLRTRPGEQADLLVFGGDEIAHHPEREVVLATEVPAR